MWIYSSKCPTVGQEPSKPEIRRKFPTMRAIEQWNSPFLVLSLEIFKQNLWIFQKKLSSHLSKVFLLLGIVTCQFYSFHLYVPLSFVSLLIYTLIQGSQTQLHRGPYRDISGFIFYFFALAGLGWTCLTN